MTAVFIFLYNRAIEVVAYYTLNTALFGKTKQVLILPSFWPATNQANLEEVYPKVGRCGANGVMLARWRQVQLGEKVEQASPPPHPKQVTSQLQQTCYFTSLTDQGHLGTVDTLQILSRKMSVRRNQPLARRFLYRLGNTAK
jgi:hypothetical protein